MAASEFLPTHSWFDILSEPGVHIYQCAFSIADYHNDLFVQLGVPWADNLERAVDKRKSEFLAGRFCAKQALAALDVHNFAVVAGKNRCPQWPGGIKGAITHSNSKALVAVTNRSDVLGIGIDIENIMTESTMNNVKSAIVHGDENAFLSGGDFTAAEATSLIFSIKESFFKAAYPSTGRYFDFDAVTITKLDRNTGQFTLTVNEDLNPQVRPGMSYCGRFVFIEAQVLSLLLI